MVLFNSTLLTISSAHCLCSSMSNESKGVSFPLTLNKAAALLQLTIALNSSICCKHSAVDSEYMLPKDGSTILLAL